MTISTDLVQLTERASIECFLRTDPALHLYALGDLDEFFWPHTTWYGLMGPEGPRAVFLLYRAVEPPVLLALEENDPPAALELLARVLPALSRQFYAHLSPYLMEPLGARRHLHLPADDNYISPSLGA